MATGAAVGLLFAGTGVFTKEIGDRIALYGARGLPSVLASSGLWLMLAMAAWSQSLLQQAFRKANAATVSAANASVASLGLDRRRLRPLRPGRPEGGRRRSAGRGHRRLAHRHGDAARCSLAGSASAARRQLALPAERDDLAPQVLNRPRGRRPGRLGYGSRAGPGRARRLQRSWPSGHRRRCFEGSGPPSTPGAGPAG